MRIAGRSTIGVLILGLMVFCSGPVTAAPMPTGFTYQGRLTDSGGPANGEFDLQFRLFDAETGGNQISTSAFIDQLAVIDGHFAVQVDFGSNVFTGNAIWLEIGVRPGADEDPADYTILSPRELITPVPYALYAASGTPGPQGPQGPQGARGATGPWGPQGIKGDTGDPGPQGPRGATGPQGSQGVSGPIGPQGAKGDTGDPGSRGPQGVSGPMGPQGPVGDSRWLLNGAATYYNNGNVGIGTTSPSAKLQVVGNVNASGSSSAGIISGTNIGSGYGVYGEASGNSGRGIRGVASGSTGQGVQGYASNAGSYTNYGGYFLAAGSSGQGVYGEASGYSGRGVRGVASGWDGQGVQGYASNSGGGNSYGGYFVAAGVNGRGVYGSHSAAGGTAAGVHGVSGSTSSNAVGVLGEISNTNPGGSSAGVRGINKGTGELGIGVWGSQAGSGRGVYGTSVNGTGVYGEASNLGVGANINYGGYFVAAGVLGQGVYGEATGGFGTGVWAVALANNGIGVQSRGGLFDFYAAGPGEDYGSASSIRWKSDIRAINEPLEKVMRLRGVYFNWDAEHGGGHDVGMIAEEVGQVLPEIVVYEENGIDASGMDYGMLTPLLVEAVKALKIEVNELQKQNAEKDAVIDTLKQHNDKLEGRLAALESSIATITVQLKGGGK